MVCSLSLCFKLELALSFSIGSYIVMSFFESLHIRKYSANIQMRYLIHMGITSMVDDTNVIIHKVNETF